MSEIKELFQLRSAVAAEAVRNPDFLASLKSDPQAALKNFTGTDFSGVNISVVEEDGDTIVFPIAKIGEDLTADQLEAVAGGAFFGVTAAAVGAAAACVGAAGTVAATTYTIGKGEGAW